MESAIRRQSLIDERRNRGLSVGAAAKAMDIARNTLVRFEAGGDVNLASAKRIADFYECKVVDLPAPEATEIDEAA